MSDRDDVACVTIACHLSAVNVKMSLLVTLARQPTHSDRTIVPSRSLLPPTHTCKITFLYMYRGSSRHADVL